MNAEQLLQHFERINEAPDAIPRLRRFILDLAVRGKLVEQDPNDEKPTDFKKQDKSTTPFDLPSCWKWIEIGEQLNLLNGMAFKPTDWRGKGLRIVRIQNLNNPNATFNFCDPDIVRERSLIDDGAFLISWSGTPGTSFGAFIWERGLAVLNQHIFRCDFKTNSFTASFLRLAINGRLDEMISKAHGGVGLQHITKGKLEALLIPLPPLAEQHRIVAKVDELMSLCDQLEAAKAEREQCRDRLVAACLQGLNQPAEEEATFRKHACFTFTNLPRITTRAAHIKQLRQTILNLAVRGKLVPQHPSDEPATLLLEQVLAQPWAKKRKSLELLSKKDPPPLGFPLPEGWCWVVVEMLLRPNETLTYGILKPEWVADGIPTVRVTEMKTGVIDLASLPLCDPGRASRFQKTTLKPGDLLISKDGTIGKTAFVPPELAGGNITQHVLRYPITESVDRFFVRLTIDSPFCQQWMVGETKGVALKGVNVGDFRLMPLPLPPLAEQHRIVVKVNELMAICDQLETQITVREQDNRRFLEAVLNGALCPVLVAVS